MGSGLRFGMGWARERRDMLFVDDQPWLLNSERVSRSKATAEHDMSTLKLQYNSWLL